MADRALPSANIGIVDIAIEYLRNTEMPETQQK
jgi:hypothetical protein